MTTIVYRDGIIAADSQLTTEASEDRSGHSAIKRRCQKLFPMRLANGQAIIVATAGESAPGLWFVDWISGKRGNDAPDALHDSAEIDCLVLSSEGLFEYDQWCHGEKITAPFHAIGSGAKAALGALHMGATALQAVIVASEIDPYTSGPFTVMTLEDVK